MKKLITLVFLFIPFLVSAQEKEVWACQGNDSNGFDWDGNKWQRMGFGTHNVLFTINGTNGSLKLDGHDYTYLVCSHHFLGATSDPFLSCSDDSVALQFVINPDTGDAALSQLLGVVPSKAYASLRDSLAILQFQCVKF
jgi:hypothetical protein